MELKKQITWSETRPRLYHLRNQAGREVDLVLEEAAGRLASVEVKSAATASAGDFRGLRASPAPPGTASGAGYSSTPAGSPCPSARRCTPFP